MPNSCRPSLQGLASLPLSDPLGEASGLPSPPLLLQIMHALTVTAKLSALFGGSLFALFVGTLIIEDQRHLISCRMAGGSADACLLRISGR